MRVPPMVAILLQDVRQLQLFAMTEVIVLTMAAMEERDARQHL